MTVVVDVDGTHHRDHIDGKDARAAVMAMKRYTMDSDGALVFFRMRYARGEDSNPTDSGAVQEILHQTQQWMVHIINNSAKFFHTKRTIFYHGYGGIAQRKVPDIITENFAVVCTEASPVHVVQLVSSTRDLELARMFAKISKAASINGEGAGYNDEGEKIKVPKGIAGGELIYKHLVDKKVLSPVLDPVRFAFSLRS